MKLTGLSGLILLRTSCLLLCSVQFILAFAREEGPSPEGALSHPSGHRAYERLSTSLRERSQPSSTQLLSDNIHRRRNHHQKHNEHHHKRQRRLTPAERQVQPFSKGKHPPSLFYQLDSQEPTLERRGARNRDFHGEIPTNTPEKIRPSPSNDVNDVITLSPAGHEQSGTSGVSTAVEASANDVHRTPDGHFPETERSKYDIHPETFEESSYSGHISSLFDSLVSWWSSKSSSNSSSSSSLSSTQSSSPPHSSHQPSPTVSSVLRRGTDGPHGLSEERRLAARITRRRGHRRKSDLYHDFKRTVRSRGWSHDVTYTGLKKRGSRDNNSRMFGDAPHVPAKNRRKGHPKRRTRKKKRRGLRSTKKRKTKKKSISTTEGDKTHTTSAGENVTNNVSDKTLEITTSTNMADTSSGEIYYEIKRTWNGKVGRPIRESTTRTTTNNDIDTNGDEFVPSTPVTSSLKLNVDHTRKAPTNVRLVDDEDLKDIDDEEHIIMQRNEDSQHNSQDGKVSDKFDSNPVIGIHVRTHQRKWERNRGDTAVEEQGGPIEGEEEETVEPVEEGREMPDENPNENLSKASAESSQDVSTGARDGEEGELLEMEEVRRRGDGIGTDGTKPTSASQPGTGIFATVRELVTTVKDLYTQQELNRKSINELFSRYRSQRTDLHLTEAKVSTLEQNLRGLASTLQNLDVTAGGIRQEMTNFRNRQQRTDRNQRRLRLETERLLGKVNRLDDEQEHLKALHDSNSGHMLVSSELSKTSAKLERFSSRVERLERLDLKRSSRTSKLHKKLDSLEEGLDMAQVNLKDVASDAKDCSGQIGSLRVALDDLIDNMEVAMNPEFLEALKGLGVNSNGIARDSMGEFSGEGVSDEDNRQSVKDDIYLTTKSSRDEQAESANGSDTLHKTSTNSKNKLRKSRHLDSSPSDSKSISKSSPVAPTPPTAVADKGSYQSIKENTTTAITSALDSSDALSSTLGMTTSSYRNTLSKMVGGVEREGNRPRLYNQMAINQEYQEREPTEGLWPTQLPTTDGVTSFSHSQSIHNRVSANLINENVHRYSTSLESESDISSDVIRRSTSQQFDNDNSRLSTHEGRLTTNTDLVSDATVSSIQPTSVSSIQKMATINGHGETSTAHFSHASRNALPSIQLQSSHNQLESHSWMTSKPLSKLPHHVPSTSSESASSNHVSETHHVEYHTFSWNDTFLQHHIRKLEQRIRILESSMMKLTSSTVPGLGEELNKALNNYTANVKAELLQQKADAANRTAFLKEEIEENFNRSSTLEERFKKREMDLHRLKTISGQTSIMITDLANQVSAINMSEFISRLQFSLANFTRSVLTLDQWKLASDVIINTTADHEAKISHLSEAIKSNTQETTKLVDRVAASQASSRRWYRNLQGHVIRLNNTVQDFKDRTELRMQEKTKDTQSSQPSMELQAKMDSLHIQLLYNSNRLSGLETTMMNRSLEQCRRATAELEQQASLVRHEQDQKVLRNDLELLQEKVQRIDLSVYRMHTGIKTSDAVVSRLSSDIRHLKPVTSQVVRLEKEVDNLLHQVPRDCQVYFSRGYRASGVYIIYPKQVGRSIRVYCVMEEHEENPNNDLLSGSNEIIASSKDDDGKSIRERKGRLINDGDDTANDADNDGKENKKEKRRRTRKKRKNETGGDGPQMSKPDDHETEFEDFPEEDQDGLFLEALESRPSDSDLYNGGWTVIQRRYSGNVNFTRSWLEYAMGFGSAMDEYWLGNDVIHLLTNQDSYECRILMTDVFDGVWEARYDHFRVGSPAENYRLQVSGYHGNASDGLSSANHMSFSTLDRDNDASSPHCALYGRGGWWYRHCHISNLNGPFDVGLVWFNRAWRDWVQMKTSLIMVKPRSGKTRT